MGTVIDLSKCDGCKGEEVPRCVSACRRQNQDKFPEPAGEMHDYWPQKKHEDWSDKRHLTDRLTPYNWTFVQRVEVEQEGEKTSSPGGACTAIIPPAPTSARSAPRRRPRRAR